MLGQSPPLLGLRGQHEVHHVVWQQAQLSVVVLRPPTVVTARLHPVVPEGLRALAHLGPAGRYLIGAPPQQRRLNGILEGTFRKSRDT